MIQATPRMDMVRAMEFMAEQSIKGMVRTMIPGIVKEYNSKTKRASVQPAIRRLDSEGNGISRPLLIDVPVVSYATGGMMIHQSINVEDTVMLIFSERGLDEFKEQWVESNATPGRFYNVMDAVALRWGVETISPIDEDGVVIQSESGDTYFKIKEGLIEMKVGETTFRMTPTSGRMS